MSKGLEALKEIKNKPFSWEKLKESLDTIEKELKRLEELEIMYSNCVIESAKQKKALEIIKEDFFAFIDFKEEKRETKTYYLIDFNRGDYKVYLPKEKWDLLKKVLL